MIPTLLVSPAELGEERIEVTGDSYRHLFRAKRLAVGDDLRLVDGTGKANAGRILSVDRTLAWIQIGEILPSLEATTDVTLWVAIPKMDRAAWLVEKATEIGVNTLVFVRFGRSNRDLGSKQLERLRRVCVAAVQQCGRARIPEILDPVSLESSIERMTGRTLLLDPGASGGIVLSSTMNRVGLIVGPEGGVDPGEASLLEDAGIQSLSLGERILRIETAALVASGRFLSRPDA